MRAERCLVAPGEEMAWDEYVLRCPAAGVYHRYGWSRVIERSYGHEPIYLWAREGGAIRGVLPLVAFRGPLGGRSLVSLPFLDEGGLCADDDESRAALWEAARETSARLGARSIELRQRYPSGLDLPPQAAKVTVMLELATEPEQMWKRLDAKVRNQVRKAKSSGLTASWCGVEGLDEFYGVFAHNMRDLGSPVHARRFFGAMLEEFADTARLLLVRDGARTVAGGVCMIFRDTVLVPWASSLRAWRSRCPSNLLYWEVIRSACDKGLSWLDFGRSSRGGGTYRFKVQWGGSELPLHWEVFPAQQGQSFVHSEDPKYRAMIGLWQRLPVPVATLIGPTIRKRLSN